MKKIRQEPTPQEYLQGGLLDQLDFHDTFATTNHQNSLKEIAHLVFDNPPDWIRGLFTVRNKLVRLVGLKTEIPADYHKNFEPGGYIGFFKIFSISDTELVLGADDSHLNFRAVLKIKPQPTFNIKVITLVQFNNSFGRFYMKIIKPFHRLVIMQLVKNGYK